MSPQVFAELRLQCDYAAQDVLDSLRSAGFISGFRLAAVVGGGGHNPDFISVVVDRLPQRLVLNADRFSVWRGRPRPRKMLVKVACKMEKCSTWNILSILIYTYIDVRNEGKPLSLLGLMPAALARRVCPQNLSGGCLSCSRFGKGGCCWAPNRF